MGCPVCQYEADRERQQADHIFELEQKRTEAEKQVEEMIPGQHFIIVSDHFSLFGRDQGWELRDTILIIGPKILCAFLFRVPLSEPTIVQQVLKTGTGGLNIDGCRIITRDNLDGGAYAKSGKDRYDGYEKWRYKRRGGAGEYNQPTGRWPTNLILIHSPDCTLKGTKKIKANSEGAGCLWSHYRDNKLDKAKATPSKIGDEDGMETVPAWSCAPGCPVKALDKQSGIRPSTGPHPSTSKPLSKYRPTQGNYQPQGPLYSDIGGASRFYPQFGSLSEAVDWLNNLVNGRKS